MNAAYSSQIVRSEAGFTARCRSLQRIKYFSSVVGAVEPPKAQSLLKRLARVAFVLVESVRRAEMVEVDRVVWLCGHGGLQGTHGQRRLTFLVVKPTQRVVHFVCRRQPGFRSLGELEGHVQVLILVGIKLSEIVRGEWRARIDSQHPLVTRLCFVHLALQGVKNSD